MFYIKLLQPFPLLVIILPLFLVIIISKLTNTRTPSTVPNSYPIVGTTLTLCLSRKDRLTWVTDALNSSPTSTFTFHRPLNGRSIILTSNPENVQHILKTRFLIYEKGDFFKSILFDFLGDGIFNVDGDNWKSQRKIASHEFNTKSLKKFVEEVIDTELNDRLIPILGEAAKEKKVLDFQDVLQRFAFDNICRISFGYDPVYLSPDFPVAKFAAAFEDAVMISTGRFRSFFPQLWWMKRLLNVGSERRLKEAVTHVREFAEKIIKQKKTEMERTHDSAETAGLDLLSRFIKSGHSDERFVADIVISFLLAGRDTTSAALTWFFWLISKNPEVESNILKEISTDEAGDHQSIYEGVKEMMYTHAALCESMRLYPPVPIDSKEAIEDDVLPDGTVVRKGIRVAYHPYAMGRSEKLWGKDWSEFKPERWLQRGEETEGKWKFVSKDPYSYPVFQAGPRICLGKEMAFLQMKMVVAGVLRRFKVVAATDDGSEPTFLPYLTAKMKGGLSVRFIERV